MSDYLLGVNWSRSELGIVCFRKTGKLYRFVKIDTLVLPAEDPEDSFQKWLDVNLPKNSHVSAVVSVPESMVFLEQLTLPKLGDKELGEAIYWEVSSKATAVPTDSLVEWKKISETESGILVSAMVMKKEDVEAIVTLFRGVNIRIDAIEPTSVSFARITGNTVNPVSLLVTVERDETNFIILKQGTAVFSSSIPVSLATLVTQRQRLDTEVRAQLASSARRVFSFWQEKHEKPASQVILTGSGVRYTGLAHSINQVLHIPVVLGKWRETGILKSIKLSAPQYLIPLGAASRAFFPKLQKEVNFLPAKEKNIQIKDAKQKTIRSILRTVINVHLVFLIVIALLFGYLQYQNISLTKDRAQTRVFIQNHPAQKYVPEIASTNQTMNQVQTLLTNQKDSGDKLSKLALVTPAGVQYTAIKFIASPSEIWEIDGIADRSTILAFYQKLKSDLGAKTVSMPYSNLEKENQAEFKMIIIW